MFERLGATRTFAATFVAFYIVATILLGIGAYWLSDRALTRQIEERVAAEAGLLQHIQQQSGLDELRAALRRRDGRGVNVLGYLLLDARGQRLGGDLNLPQLPPGWHTAEFVDFDGAVLKVRALVIALDGGARLTVASEVEPVEQLRNTMVWLFAGGVLFMLIGGLGGAFLFSRRLHYRLDVMNDTALAIIRGDQDKRVPLGPDGDEFDRLAGTLNRMLDRNAALVENLRQVSSDIAHDLRTPIAHLRQCLERALALRPDVTAMEGQIEAAIEQSSEILSLFSALLRIAEVESGALRRYFECFDLSGEITKICESYQAVAEDNGQSLEARIEGGLTLVGDRELVLQALINLLENSLQHSGDATTITAHLGKTGHVITMAVIDDGRGVASADLASLTDRFKRADLARNTPGFGLGLNLVSAIARTHDAELVLRNRKPGFEARLEFPMEARR